MAKDLEVREGSPSSGNIDSDKLLADVRSLVERARYSLAQVVNTELVLL